MNQLELAELRKLWIDAVITFERPDGRLALRGCWFCEHRDVLAEVGVDIGPAEGPIQGAHWIKRQRAERDVKRLAEWAVEYQDPTRISAFYIDHVLAEEIAQLAGWDPRNGVPACQRHHTVFDSQRVPLPSEQIVVPRLLVPRHVIEFSEEKGLETAIEEKHPQEVS